jgi:hypothetical protein
VNPIAAPVARRTADQTRRPDGLAATDSPDAQAGLLGRVVPNSRLHWALLILGLAGSIAFNVTWFVEGLLRPGYDPVAQPISALSLGAGGWVQITNFAVFGAIGCVSAFAWRPTLAPGLGATWYPRLRIIAGVAMIGAAIFSQDPSMGFPVGVPALAHLSVHAQIHNAVSYISLTTTVAELLILARRLHREPSWRGWAPAALTAGVLMMVFLAVFGILTAQHGPGGTFEKLASLTPSLFGIALAGRLLLQRDARISVRARRC